MTVLYAGWSPQVRVSDIQAMEPSIAIDKDGKIWVSFTSLYSGIPDPVFVTYSYDGYTWAEPETVSTPMPPNAYLDAMSSIGFISPGHPLIEWNRSMGTYNYSVHYSYLQDTGWTDPARVDTVHPLTGSSEASSSDSGLWIVWTVTNENFPNFFDSVDLYAARWTGDGWGDMSKVHPPDTNGEAWQNIDVDRWGNPHIAYTFWPDWENSGKTDVYYVTLRGDTWTTPLKINPDFAEYSLDMDLAVDTLGNVHFVWVEYYYGRDSLCYRAYNGYTLGPRQVIASIYTYPNYPRIEADDPDNVWVVWGDNNHVWAMHYNGMGWYGPQQIDNSSTSFDGEITIELDKNGLPHVIWAGWVGEYPNDTSLIFYSKYNPEYIQQNSEVEHPFMVKLKSTLIYSDWLQAKLHLTTSTDLIIQIFDISGRQKEKIYYSELPSGNHILNLNLNSSTDIAFPNGMYIIKFNIANQSQAIKFLKVNQRR